jgi:hypothetical protein
MARIYRVIDIDGHVRKRRSLGTLSRAPRSCAENQRVRTVTPILLEATYHRKPDESPFRVKPDDSPATNIATGHGSASDSRTWIATASSGHAVPVGGLYLTSVRRGLRRGALPRLIVGLRLLQRGSKTAHGRGRIPLQDVQAAIHETRRVI